jgi:acetyltransferase
MRIAANPAAAAAAAIELGFPVALKIRSPDIRHKSEVGGVLLNLGNPRRVRAEAAAMLERIAALRPSAQLDGFLVQRMVTNARGVELIVGIIEDSVFGPVVLFGRGGTAVEQINDITLELPPLNDTVARAQIARTRIWRQLQGYRDQPPADIAAIADLLVRIAQLAADHPGIAELYVNPVLASADGVIALDARLRIDGAAPAGPARLAISPYPRELESTATLNDGTVLRLRPVRPEDEPLIQDVVAHMSPEDVRLRFFTPLRGLSHELAARLSQIDYDRAIAIIALSADGSQALGVARFACDPDNRAGEYAIGLRSDWKGHGVGYVLMNRLFEIARRRGIQEIFGDVLRENEPMLQMCRSLGFSLSVHPQEPEVVRVTKLMTLPDPV